MATRCVGFPFPLSVRRLLRRCRRPASSCAVLALLAGFCLTLRLIPSCSSPPLSFSASFYLSGFLPSPVPVWFPQCRSLLAVAPPGSFDFPGSSNIHLSPCLLCCRSSISSKLLSFALPAFPAYTSARAFSFSDRLPAALCVERYRWVSGFCLGTAVDPLRMLLGGFLGQLRSDGRPLRAYDSPGFSGCPFPISLLSALSSDVCNLFLFTCCCGGLNTRCVRNSLYPSPTGTLAPRHPPSTPGPLSVLARSGALLEGLSCRLFSTPLLLYHFVVCCLPRHWVFLGLLLALIYIFCNCNDP